MSYNPMRLFVDCEFNEFGGELISMALVSDEGHEWYQNLGCENPKPWVAEHVMPILITPAVSRGEFLQSLEVFLRQFRTGIHIVADWPEDIAHFCQSLIVCPGIRIPTPPITMEIIRVDATSALPHNALADARGIRDAAVALEMVK